VLTADRKFNNCALPRTAGAPLVATDRQFGIGAIFSPLVVTVWFILAARMDTYSRMSQSD
jgi:hypothetical protein